MLPEFLLLESEFKSGAGWLVGGLVGSAWIGWEGLGLGSGLGSGSGVGGGLETDLGDMLLV